MSRRLVDLSHAIHPGMPSYPGLPEPRFERVRTHDDHHGAYAPGTTFAIQAMFLGGNTGTYVDAPFHRVPGGEDLARVPLDKIADLPGLVIEAPGDGALGPDLVVGKDVTGRAVLFSTGWSSRWGSEGYFRSGPFLTRAACEALAGAGAALVGIDCANIDDMNDPERPAHTTLLHAGVPIVEHLTGLDALKGSGFRFTAAPPAIVGGTSFPVRAFAIVEDPPPATAADEGLARTPAPPYYAVIFTSRRTDVDAAEYARTAARMEELASGQPGYLGVESVRDAGGLGITVSYWASQEALVAWKRVAEHRNAQILGRERWYRDYVLRVARVDRAYTLAGSAAVGLAV